MNDSTRNFIGKLQIPGANVQIGTFKAVFGNLTPDTTDLVEKCVKDNVFILGGVNPFCTTRGKDADILFKNYFFIDLDLRKQATEELSDDEIVDLADLIRVEFDKHELLKNWGDFVFTGNGLHIYFFGDPVSIDNAELWKDGVQAIYTIAWEALSNDPVYKPDNSCANCGRISRMPETMNVKGEKMKEAEILFSQDVKFDLAIVKELGNKREELAKEQADLKSRQGSIQSNASKTYDVIQEIPINGILCRLMGWECDGRNFYPPGKKNSLAACFVAKQGNCIIHGGTSHFSDKQTGYSPFQLVQEILGLTAAETFEWFKKDYPEIQAISDKETEEFKEREKKVFVNRMKIGDAFTELAGMNFEPLIMGTEIDQFKPILRAAVTRIGAFSNMGKSKFAYYLAHHLIKQSYKVMIVSTEVITPVVLANLLVYKNNWAFWDVVKRTVEPNADDVEFYKGLEIYDAKTTKNKLENVEALIDGHDVVFIDFVQGMKPKAASKDMYTSMTNYAFEVQELAQIKNCAIVDLSQISNEGLSDLNSDFGFIPYKYSGDLYSSTDIGILLKRKKMGDEANLMNVHMRKHKYESPADFQMECNFASGSFKYLETEVDFII